MDNTLPTPQNPLSAGAAPSFGSPATTPSSPSTAANPLPSTPISTGSYMQPQNTVPTLATAPNQPPSDVDLAKLNELKQRLEELKMQTGISPAPMAQPNMTATPSEVFPAAEKPTLATPAFGSAIPSVSAPMSSPPPTLTPDISVTPPAQPVLPTTSSAPQWAQPAESTSATPQSAASTVPMQSAAFSAASELTMGTKLPNPSTEAPKKHSSKAGLVILLVVAALAAVGFAAYTILSRPTAPQQIIETPYDMMQQEAVSAEMINMEPVSPDTGAPQMEPTSPDTGAPQMEPASAMEGQVQGWSNDMFQLQ